MYAIIKAILFRFDAEKAHSFTTTLLTVVSKIPLLHIFLARLFRFDREKLTTELWGLTFKNPIGLAAGFDKDGRYIRPMALLGFGFIELGTVTPRPQIGNPKPRLFRLVKDKAIINRMGFNNRGVDYLVERLKAFDKKELIIGGNIGKNKDTPNEKAFEDYLICFQKLYEYVDYFVVNLSSPNTPGLRELQDKKPLSKILNTLIDFRLTQKVKRPILLKIAPDLSQSQLNDVINIVDSLDIDGIIATNTTISRDGLKTEANHVEAIGSGGLSGEPLLELSTSVVSYISDQLKGNVPIVAVGGISSGESAERKIDAGAHLLQIYSGLIYKGPFLVKKIKKHLHSKLA